ncbi:MAG: DUF2490 domain-containing protein [Crocinitomicaceae bacterium]|nr:DUF2490 domain-containing protein [Crocinitomicaceae bacterium]
MKQLSFLILLISCSSFSQDKDALLWTGVGADLDLTKKISLEFEGQARFKENMSQFNQIYGELGAAHDLMYGFKTGLAYRYSRKFNGDYYYNDNRFCIDVVHKYKTEFGLDFSTRLRFQHSFDRLTEVNYILPSTANTLRLSFKTSYKHKDFKRVQPFAGFELFHAIQPKNQYSFIDTYRIKAGINLDLPKRHGFKLYYIYENEYRASDNHNHIYCIQYNYSFKLPKKNKNSDNKN